MAKHIDLTGDEPQVVPPLPPGGYVPSYLPTSELRNRLQGDERNSQLTALNYVADSLGDISLLARTIDGPIADVVSTEASRLQRLIKAITTGALVLALAIVTAVALPTGDQAQAATAGPAKTRLAAGADMPVSATYRVTLGARPVQIQVRAHVYTGGMFGYCASVWTRSQGMLSRSCANGPTLTVPVSISPRYWTAGRTIAQVVDDGTDSAVATVVIDARRPSRFGVGTYTDLGAGNLGVRVPVTLYNPALGRWVGQAQSPVQIQRLTRRGWRVVTTLTTDPPGVAAGIVHLGGGQWVIRAVRPAGATVWGVTGTARTVGVTTEPLDID